MQKKPAGNKPYTPGLRWAAGPLVGLVILAGCQAPEPLQPTMSDSLYQALTIEFHLAASRAEVMVEPQIERRDSILQHFGVSEAAYEQMTDYYLKEDPDRLQELLNEALDILGKERFGQ